MELVASSKILGKALKMEDKEAIHLIGNARMAVGVAKGRRSAERAAASMKKAKLDSETRAAAEQQAAMDTAREKLRSMQARRANRGGTLLTSDYQGSETLGG